MEENGKTTRSCGEDQDSRSVNSGPECGGSVRRQRGNTELCRVGGQIDSAKMRGGGIIHGARRWIHRVGDSGSDDLCRSDISRFRGQK